MKSTLNIFYSIILSVVVFVLADSYSYSSANINTTLPQHPNFILIMADDLGYGDIGCYGSKTIVTPNLDRLASEGMRFTDYHSNGAVCSPTRAALMTGKYQQRVGIEGVITAAHNRDVREMASWLCRTI